MINAYKRIINLNILPIGAAKYETVRDIEFNVSIL